MKFILFILFASIINSTAVLAGDEFKWTERDEPEVHETKVQFGTRMQRLNAWSRNLLMIQCAVKNASSEFRHIEVGLAGTNIPILFVDYRLIVYHEDTNQSSPTELRIFSGGVSKASKPGKKDRGRFIRLAPGEVFECSPVMVDLGSEQESKKMSLTTRLTMGSPPSGESIELTKNAAGIFVDDDSKVVIPKVATGQWILQIPIEKKRD